MNIRKWLSVGAGLVALLGCSAQPVSSQHTATLAARSPAGLVLAPLEIRAAAKVHRFTVEVAASPEEQERGLMYRLRLGPDEGMIFPMEPPRMAGFWMKNTKIPLDMIFIRPDGVIARIAVNTVPEDLSVVYSGVPVGAVLELAGGRTVELGIKAGDKVSWHLP